MTVLKPAPPPEPAPKAEPPRQPQRADRRRIMEALDAAYPAAERGYAGQASDASVAAGLDVPRAWVSDIREQLYGPERVFDAPAFERKLSALRADLKAAEDGLIAQLSGLERAVNALGEELKRGTQS